MLKDHHLTLKEITAEVGISIGLVHSILTEDLWMWRVLAKIFFLSADRGTKRAYRGKENTAFHSAYVIQDFLAKNCMPLLRQAPYSLDLVPCNFWLFPKLKTTLKGKQF